MKKSIPIAIIVIAILLSGSFLELVSAFIPDGIVNSAKDTDTSSTAIYKSISKVTESFYESVTDEMLDKEKELVEENTTEETVTDDAGNIITIKKCKLNITRKLSYIGDSYLVAYLECVGGLELGTAVINETMASSFLNEICSLEVKKVDDENYEISNVFLDEDEMAEKYFDKKASKTKFISSSRAYAEYFNVNDVEVNVDVYDMYDVEGAQENFLKVPLFLQYSGKWANVSYGNGTIAKNGCCPTCLAMVFSYLNKKYIYPDDIVAWCGNKYYVTGAGTSWSIFEPAAKEYGAKVTNIGKNEKELITALSDGKIVMASMGKGTFTQKGHFIVLTGITEDGKILVNDPNDNATKKHKDTQFELSLILRECKNLWVFEVAE